jgi:hypothetical protein
MKILVSPLGLSPGAVSGLYYALQRELGVKVDKVVIIGTNDPRLFGCRRILEDLFREEGVDYDTHSIPFADLRGPGAVRAFCRYVAATLAIPDESDEIYLGISAGYGSMGALALLVARENKAVDEVYDLWIDDETQQMGHIDRFGQLAPEDQVRVLQPLGSLTVIPITAGNARLQWSTDRGSEHDGQLWQKGIESLRKRLALHRRNRDRLQERAAAYSKTEVPLEILNKIDAEEEAIRDIEASLEQLGAM